MNSLVNVLKGKKTYIIAVVLVLIVICEKVLGIDIPGAEVVNPGEYILAALGISSLRAGIDKSGPP